MRARAISRGCWARCLARSGWYLVLYAEPGASDLDDLKAALLFYAVGMANALRLVIEDRQIAEFRSRC